MVFDHKINNLLCNSIWKKNQLTTEDILNITTGAKHC